MTATSELVHQVALDAVAYDSEVERLSLVFVEHEGQVYRMELLYWPRTSSRVPRERVTRQWVG